MTEVSSQKSEERKKKYKKQPSIATRRKWIDLFYKQNATPKAIADDFNYPIHTVYRVLRKADPNRKERSDSGKKRATPVLDIDFEHLSTESHETNIELFIHEVMRGISLKKRLSVGQALSYTNQLTGALKKLRSVQFGQMAKNLDVRIVEAIIRKYEPDASDMRVIEIFKEVAAQVKADKQ